jgi:uncharacterized membrane protein YheB (UPF0754 family)
MMFRPIEFVGIKPFLGWQGIVPRKAARTAAIACDTMTDRLISAGDVVQRLDPGRVAKELERPLLEAVDEITREIASEYQPALWESLPPRVQGMVVENLVKDKELLNRIFQEAGRKEFRFIARSGLVFGFAIGFVQATAS